MIVLEHFSQLQPVSGLKYLFSFLFFQFYIFFKSYFKQEAIKIKQATEGDPPHIVTDIGQIHIYKTS